MGKLNFNSMKFEKFLRVTLGFVGTNIFLTPLWGSLIAGMIFENQRNQRSNIDNEKFEKYKEYFNRTEYGDLLRFETSKNPIPVILDSTLTEDVKKQVVTSLNEMDNLLDTVNYKIYNGENGANQSGLEYIKIKMLDDFDNYGIKDFAGGFTSAGHATTETDLGPVPGEIRYNELKATISFPIQITIDATYTDKYWNDDKTKSMLDTIIKREIMRTLGFKFLNDEKYKDSTIMWSDLTTTSPDFTDSDIEMIQYCYNGKKVADVKTPKKYYTYCTKPNPLAEVKTKLKDENEFTM